MKKFEKFAGKKMSKTEMKKVLGGNPNAGDPRCHPSHPSYNPDLINSPVCTIHAEKK